MISEKTNLDESNTSQQQLINCAVKVRFEYVPPNELPRDYSDVLLNDILKEKLLDLNKGNYVDGESFTTDAILTLHRIINSCDGVGLISANKDFYDWINGNHSLKHGENGKDIPVRFIDFDHPEYNSLIVSKEVQYPRSRHNEGKAFDFVAYINGIPFVVGEAKSPFNPDKTAETGAEDIYYEYQKEVPKFFVPNLMCVSSDSKDFIYASIGTVPYHWGPWLIDGIQADGSYESVGKSIESILRPAVLLDIAKFFTTYRSNDRHQLSKIICRYQQYEGANGIVKRALSEDDNKGLIHHFQGSGKSFLMLFAAQKLRQMEALNNPTVIIVVDRTNLDDQICTDFELSDIPNVKPIENTNEFKRYLSNDSHYIYITTIHKFRTIPANISLRKNIYVFCDEAHRTEYGSLSQSMRFALPNAMFFGLTGTPISKNDRNTFRVFGSEKDERHYLSKYSFSQSIKDRETLPLLFLPKKITIDMDKVRQTKEFDELTEDLTDEQRNYLATKATTVGKLLMQDLPATQVCANVKEHFLSCVKPKKFKAMLVAQDRFCCVEYKKRLDKLFEGTGVETAVIISGYGKKDVLKNYVLSHDDEVKVLYRYNDPEDPLGILIVTGKLITGFSSKILQTQYLVKYLKEHTLLQCVTRVNRPYNECKKCGVIVDFLGVFDDIKQVLSYGDVNLDGLIKSIEVLKKEFPTQYDKTMNYLKDFSHEEKHEEFEKIRLFFENNKNLRQEFGKQASYLQRMYNVISPDLFLEPYVKGYNWLLKVIGYCASRNKGSSLWSEFGPEILKIIGNSITNVEIDEDFDSIVLDEHLIRKAFSQNPEETIRSFSFRLGKKLNGHPQDPLYIHLSQRLEKLKQQMEVKQISSTLALEELLKLSKEYLELKNLEQTNPHEYAIRVLSIYLESIMTENTPEDLIKAVHEIDDFIVGYKYDFENSREGMRAVKGELTRILYKYKVYSKENVDQTLRYMQLCYAYKNKING